MLIHCRRSSKLSTITINSIFIPKKTDSIPLKRTKPFNIRIVSTNYQDTLFLSMFTKNQIQSRERIIFISIRPNYYGIQVDYSFIYYSNRNRTMSRDTFLIQDILLHSIILNGIFCSLFI